MDETLAERVRALADEWEQIGREGMPHRGCLDMYRHCAGVLHALLGDWVCGGCGATAEPHAKGWSYTDAAWCPKCGWLR